MNTTEIIRRASPLLKRKLQLVADRCGLTLDEAIVFLLRDDIQVNFLT